MGIDRIKDAPRRQHYYFAHQFLRERAEQNPKILVSALRNKSGSAYLSFHWATIAISLKDQVGELIPADGLECFPIELDDEYYGVLVQFPEPKKVTEAYFVAILLPASEEDPASARYITLEFSLNDDRSKKTMLCEWNRGSHSNYGDGPPPEKEAFLSAVRRLVLKPGRKVGPRWITLVGEKPTRRSVNQAPIEQGIALMNSQRFDEALLLFHQALEKDPSQWNVLYMAGQCCRFLNDIDGAIEYLSRAATLKDDEPSVFLALGIAFQLNVRWDEAIEAFRRAIEIDADCDPAYNSLALTQKKRGELDKALHNYDAGAKALARRIVKGMNNNRASPILKQCNLRGSLWTEYAMYAAVYLASGAQGIDRIAWPTGEQAQEEERTKRHGGLYWVDLSDGDGKTARLFLPNYFNTFCESLRRDPAYSNLIGNRGTVLELLGRRDEARQHFEEASEFHPQRAKRDGQIKGDYMDQQGPPTTDPSGQNEMDDTPNKRLAEMMKETLRHYNEMSPEEKKAYWERVVPNPPPFLTGEYREDISPFSGIPLSELDRLGLPRPNYDRALKNMAIIFKAIHNLRSKGFSQEEAKEAMRDSMMKLVSNPPGSQEWEEARQAIERLCQEDKM